METLPGLTRNEILAPYTTYNIGGPADYFVTVRTKSELIRAITVARAVGTDWFLLGTGANILIGDRGFRGLVIRNRFETVSAADNLVTAGSGTLIERLISWSTRHELSGLEHFAGIPSTLGGALRQNLHFLAPDRLSTLYLGTLVRDVDVLDETGAITRLTQASLNFGYDTSIFHHRPLVALTARLQLMPRSAAQITTQISANLQWRNERQPQLPAQPSCGSVFKKLNEVGAGRLIDAAGLKGYQIGGVQVSPQHANYLVNMGGATAADVRQLIAHIQTTVKATSGYDLEPEIGFIGEF